MPTVPTDRKVKIVEVFRDYTMFTIATPLANADLVELGIREVEEWGPSLLSITAHIKNWAVTGNFRWCVFLYTSFDGYSWAQYAGTTNGQIFAPVTLSQDGDGVYPAFTAADHPDAFSRHMKYVLAVWHTTGGLVPASGMASLSLEFDFKS